MRFMNGPQLRGAGRTRAGHHHGSHTPISPGTVLLGKMAYHTKQICWQCIMVHQKVPKSCFQSNFLISKINIIFSKKKSFKKINLGNHFLWKNFFFCFFIFEPIYFLKSCQFFLWTGAPRILKIWWFPLSILIFGQKSFFFGPTISKIPQPTWY